MNTDPCLTNLPSYFKAALTQQKIYPKN